MRISELVYFLMSITLAHSLFMVSRNEWGAKPPVQAVETINGTLPFVIIHHSYIPGPCLTTDSCKASMRSMQRHHQDTNGWNDIGYSYAVGGDGRIYVGRGFNIVGAHAPGYNDKSVGICLIGDWRTELPSRRMLLAVHQLIALGIVQGHVDPHYSLMGHRQVRATECPGDRLFDEIKTWRHFIPEPPSSY